MTTRGGRYLVAMALVGLLGCGSDGSGDSGPTGTVREFVQLMDRSQREPDTLREAFALLDERARRALEERAARASTLAGRRYEGWEMLAPGRFRLRFTAAPVGGMRERIEADHAVVVVTGKNDGERAEIPLIRERAGWRIQLEIPPVR